MPKYRPIGGARPSFVSMEEKDEAAIRDKLDAEDAHTIALCQKHSVIEKGEPARRRRSRK